MPETKAWPYRLYRWMWQGLDWVYPPVCGGCGRPGSRWCVDCQRKVTPVHDPICRHCGLPIQSEGLCPSCRARTPAYGSLRSWLVFEGPVRQALHKLKYRRDIALGDALAVPLADFVAGLVWAVDGVVPVPLSRQRLAERGYNQVGLVAHPLALSSGWRYLPGALRRQRETVSQVGLSAEERRVNVQDAFRADPAQVRGRRLILMDDVATTGATLEATAAALLEAGAREVNALTIARALPRHGLKEV